MKRSSAVLGLGAEKHPRPPCVVEYQFPLVKLMIASVQQEHAVAYIARIRALGPLGQHEAVARRPEVRLDTMPDTPPPP